MTCQKDLGKIFFAYKLDCSKAYDCVDWNSLEQMLQTLGFDQQRVKWIMTYVTMVISTIKFNGVSLD
jgi:hypothetical protein